MPTPRRVHPRSSFLTIATHPRPDPTRPGTLAPNSPARRHCAGDEPAGQQSPTDQRSPIAFFFSSAALMIDALAHLPECNLPQPTEPTDDSAPACQFQCQGEPRIAPDPSPGGAALVPSGLPIMLMRWSSCGEKQLPCSTSNAGFARPGPDWRRPTSRLRQTSAAPEASQPAAKHSGQSAPAPDTPQSFASPGPGETRSWFWFPGTPSVANGDGDKRHGRTYGGLRPTPPPTRSDRTGFVAAVPWVSHRHRLGGGRIARIDTPRESWLLARNRHHPGRELG
jgi:hypothetical protein